MSENNSLGDEVRTAQENLRVSANTVAKLNNELRLVCNENEELQRRSKDTYDLNRKLSEADNKIAILSQEIERLNSILEKKNN